MAVDSSLLGCDLRSRTGPRSSRRRHPPAAECRGPAVTADIRFTEGAVKLVGEFGPGEVPPTSGRAWLLGDARSARGPGEDNVTGPGDAMSQPCGAVRASGNAYPYGGAAPPENRYAYTLPTCLCNVLISIHSAGCT